MTPTAKTSLRRLALLLAGLAMFGPFSIDTIFPAFPAIGAAFGADKLAMQQTISVYLVAYALMSLVHGPLSDILGRKRVILAGLAVFTLASVGCALAEDLPTLLLFRALQGLSAGVGLIVGRAVIRDLLHGHVDEVIVDEPVQHERIVTFLKRTSPGMASGFASALRVVARSLALMPVVIPEVASTVTV